MISESKRCDRLDTAHLLKAEKALPSAQYRRRGDALEDMRSRPVPKRNTRRLSGLQLGLFAGIILTAAQLAGARADGNIGYAAASASDARDLRTKPVEAVSAVSRSDQARRVRPRTPRSDNKTVSRNGSWPEGNSSIFGHVYRKARWSRIGHARVCLSSEQFGDRIVEVEDNGSFRFRDVPAGVYALRTVETFDYQDAYYNPENQSSDRPTFQLKAGERISAAIEIQPIRPYRRIVGRILGEDGKPIANGKTLAVSAWVRKPQGRWKGYYRRVSSSGMNEDGSYALEELDGRPVYVQVLDRGAPNENDPYPPRFYPGTFSRANARLVTFGDNMFFDLFCGYTNEQGRYRIEGLGEGTFIVHVDAVYKGLVKTRKLVTIKPDAQPTQLNFTLTRGVRVSGECHFHKQFPVLGTRILARKRGFDPRRQP
ncbi:MAG: carboxypeptidase-like regulatory domain-containing protein [Sedimentisphaerales bacterium]